MTEDQLRTFHRNGDFMQALINNGVDFLIVGGMAVKVYRCREVVDDLDVMLNPTDANIQRFFHALHVSKLNVPSSTKTVSKPNVQIPLKLDLNLDVLTPPDGMDYESLKQCSSAININNITVHVVSRAYWQDDCFSGPQIVGLLFLVPSRTSPDRARGFLACR